MPAPGTALAHERRTVANGKHDVIVGWNVEPTLTGQMNQGDHPYHERRHNHARQWRGQISQADDPPGRRHHAFPLKTHSGQEGCYTAVILPARVGDHQWIFTSDINGDAVNEMFDLAEGKFNAV